jgi:putative membrane protein
MGANKGVNRPLVRFLLRWAVCSLGLWVAASILGGGISYGHSAGVIIVAGLILAVINVILRPIVIFFSLPVILLSLGLFMVVVNGFMVFLASLLYAPLEVSNFLVAMLAGLIIGLVNYLVTALLESRQIHHEQHQRFSESK